MANFHAAGLNNEATQLEMAGDFAASEAKYLEALQIRRSAPGIPDISVALTLNALGELYLKMGRLDDAERMLIDADAIRSGKYSVLPTPYRPYGCHWSCAITNGNLTDEDDFDCACTRDNIGRLYEMKGDFDKAKEWRLKGLENNHMLCSNFDVGINRR